MADEAVVKEKLDQGYLQINTVIEIVGAPKEHVEDTLRLVLKKLRDEKGVDVLGGKVHEPKPQGPFFSTFAELEILVKQDVCRVGVFKAHVNFVKPAKEVVEQVCNVNRRKPELGRLNNLNRGGHVVEAQAYQC